MTALNQRWRTGCDFYRPGDTIDPSRYEIAEIKTDNVAKRFVVSHHYSGSFPAARYRFGLYRGQVLQGVAVFSHPCNDKVLTGTFPCAALEAVELGRFVLLDEVPGNGETWFLGRCFELLRAEGLVGVVSFSDPSRRQSISGDVVFGGHVGTIYQAHNAVYLGRGTARVLRILPDGSVLSDRAIQKLRSGVKGWRYTADRLIEFGADEPTGDLRGWLARWLTKLTRPMRHPGNHKYAWGLNRLMRRLLPQSAAYPKSQDIRRLCRGRMI